MYLRVCPQVPWLQGGATGARPTRHRLRRVRERDAVDGRQERPAGLQDHTLARHEDRLRQEVSGADLSAAVLSPDGRPVCLHSLSCMTQPGSFITLYQPCGADNTLICTVLCCVDIGGRWV